MNRCMYRTAPKSNINPETLPTEGQNTLDRNYWINSPPVLARILFRISFPSPWDFSRPERRGSLRKLGSIDWGIFPFRRGVIGSRACFDLNFYHWSLAFQVIIFFRCVREQTLLQYSDSLGYSNRVTLGGNGTAMALPNQIDRIGKQTLQAM